MLLTIRDVIKLWLFFECLLIAETNSFSDSSVPKISYIFNPGCETPEYESYCSNNTQLNLIHVTVNGSENAFHFLWSTWKLPTVIIAKTHHDAHLNVNWTALLNFESGAVSFTEKPSYSIGFVVKEVWEFIDDDDKVDMNLYPNNTKPLNVSSLNWQDVNTTIKLTENLITAFPKARDGGYTFSSNGSFGIKFSATDEQTTSEDFPHLIFTGNSTQIRLVLDGLVTESRKSRFAVELVGLSSSGLDDQEWSVERDRSISDEFSPGVFRFLQLKTTCSERHEECNGVFSWKPVAYIGQKPTVANSSDAAMSSLNTSTVSVDDSIATSYFALYPNASQVLWNMTFGTSGDGCYSKTRYTSWTVMVGIGDSISHGLSKTAILVIAIGLGLPLALMVIATIYLGVTQCRRKDDELLLSQDSMN